MKCFASNPVKSSARFAQTGELSFRFDGTDFHFDLKPHNMRAPGYRAVETGPGGLKRDAPPLSRCIPSREPCVGREDTEGRFNLTGRGLEGVVYAPQGWIYLEPLRNRLAGSPAGEMVVYRQADIRPGEGFQLRRVAAEPSAARGGPGRGSNASNHPHYQLRFLMSRPKLITNTCRHWEVPKRPTVRLRAS